MKMPNSTVTLARSHRLGFSRGSEFLIAIASGILLVIGGIMVTRKSRDRQRWETCQSNVRQVASGVTMYLLDNEDIPPWQPRYKSDRNLPANIQIPTIWKGLSNHVALSALLCPSDTSRSVATGWDQLTTQKTHHGNPCAHRE